MAEYSEQFDKERKHRVEVSFHKYGPARDNFGSGRVDALATAELCIEAFKKDHNTEHMDVLANTNNFGSIKDTAKKTTSVASEIFCGRGGTYCTKRGRIPPPQAVHLPLDKGGCRGEVAVCSDDVHRDTGRTRTIQKG